jgi:hypothetical protein
MTPITIIATTYFPDGPDGLARAITADETIRSWAEHMKYGGDLRLHVADDGSNTDAENIGYRWWPVRTWSKQARRGVGASLNRGIEQALSVGDLLGYGVDDWALTGPIHLDPWAALLERDESIGCVRLGIAHPGLTGEVEHDPESGEYFLRLERHNFAFATRPFLMHRRFYEAYGPFDEGVNAYECERLFNERFCRERAHMPGCVQASIENPARRCPADDVGCAFEGERGPSVVLALLHPWHHASDIELAHIVP